MVKSSSRVTTGSGATPFRPPHRRGGRGRPRRGPLARRLARRPSAPPMAENQSERQPTQTTDKGLAIPTPSREDFDAFVRKVAPPAGRKRPAETDQPPEQSD